MSDQDGENGVIMDSNGQKYRARVDEHGWLAVEMGEMWDGEFHAYDKDEVDMAPRVHLDGTGAQQLVEFIKHNY